MKPILFNTDMVRAILEDRKTVTRRVVKDKDIINAWDCEDDGTPITYIDQATGDSYPPTHPCPYHPGDILYVRETWRIWKAYRYDADAHIEFKAGGEGTVLQFPHGGTDSINRTRYDDFISKWGVGGKWHPSIHMPREAARIFLRVTGVRVERLQDSFFTPGATIFSCQKEGIDIGDQCRDCIDTYGCPCCIDENDGDDEKACECGALDDVRSAFADLWNNCYAQPRPVKGENGVIIHYESYPWEDIQETRTYKGKPWYVIGNPWVWVIEFERSSR